MTERRLWFKAKTYGWGWRPATWEGWVATALYVFAFALWFVYVVKVPDQTHGRPTLFVIAPLALLTAGFIALCWAKGEKPNWNWKRNRGGIR